MKTVRNFINSRFIRAAVACVFMFLFIILGLGQSPNTFVRAENSVADKYTDVISDLTKDEKFDMGDYPVKDKDYSIKVIQIAESTSKELFIYTYQPSGNAYNIKANYISISTSVDADNPKWQLYSLTFCNRDGVFYKYVVNDLKVAVQLSRVYNISEIHRPWEYDFDGELPNDNYDVSVPYAVGQEWAAITVGGDVVYAFTETHTIRVTEMWCGTLQYGDGIKHTTDSHFVAFDTDYDIDKLLSADVRFKFSKCNITSVWTGSKEEWTKPKEKTVTVNYDEKGGNLDEGWFSHTYKWSRISSVEDFKNNKDVNLSKDAIKKLNGKKWVLRYYETDRTDAVNFWEMAFSGYYSHTKITDVAILRLKFDMGGKVYNLGAVSNIQSPDDIIDGESLSWWERLLLWLEENWYYIVIGIIVIVFLIIVMPFMPSILSALVSLLQLLLKGLWWLIKTIAKVLWWIISLPFRGIAALVRKIKGDDGGAP